MTYKGFANSVSKFGGILFTPIQCFGKLQDPRRWGFLCVARMDPPPPPKPLHKPWLLCQHIVTVQLSQWAISFETQLVFVYHLHRCSPWVEISTLAYETNTNCWPERFSVAYCTHIVQTKQMLKNQRYPQKSLFTATGGSTDVPFVVLGYSVGVVRQQYATHSHQSTNNVLGTLK